jgi:hypothetical protein
MDELEFLGAIFGSLAGHPHGWGHPRQKIGGNTQHTNTVQQYLKSSNPIKALKHIPQPEELGSDIA